MYYNPSTEPADTIFTAIHNLADLATAANAGYTVIQKINMALCVLRKQRVFNTSITEWNRHVRNDATNLNWNEFKRFFREKYRELNDVGELRAEDTDINQANLIREIVAALREELPSPPTIQEPPIQYSEALPTQPPSAHAVRSSTQEPDTMSALL